MTAMPCADGLRLFTLVLVGLAGVLTAGGGCASHPVTVDPDAVTWPVYDPIVNGETVVIRVVRVNGQIAPGDALAEAIDVFKRYVAGRVVVTEQPPVTPDLGEQAALSEAQLDQLVEQTGISGNSAIVLILAPALSFSADAGYTRDPIAVPVHGPPRVIVIHGAVIDGSVASMPLSREAVWRGVIAHELLHTLRVPSDRSHQWNSRHCTQKNCLLHRGIDRQVVFKAGLGWGHFGRCDLCDRCREEVRSAQEAWDGPLVPPDAPFDHVAYADRIVKLNPNRAKAYVLRAMAHLGLDSHEAALNDLTRAIELQPDWAEAYRDRATVWSLAGDCGRAIEDASRAIELAPDEPYTLNNLAWLLSTSHDEDCRDGTRAMALALRACELTERRDPCMLDTLAAAYAETGDFASAIRCLEEALALADGDLLEELRERHNLFSAGVLYRE